MGLNCLSGQSRASRVRLVMLLALIRTLDGPVPLSRKAEMKPSAKRFCAFLSHSPGAQKVLQLKRRSPSFQALSISVERRLRLNMRDSGVKGTENEASGTELGLSVCVFLPVWL